MRKVKVAIHKLTSCSGCQLAFLNQGAGLLTLLEHIEICHFVEGGIDNPEVKVDVAFVEGSISTPHDLARVQNVRTNCRVLVSVGACATSGGLQALRNLSFLYGDAARMKAAVYACPDYIATLDRSEPVHKVVTVDYELWGCPVSPQQVNRFISQLLLGAEPKEEKEKLCMQCKRLQNVCVLVTGQSPCLGAVTRTGCGAICPSYGKACYACYGPSEQPNTHSLANRLQGFGLVGRDIVQRFAQFHSHNPVFRKEIARWEGHHPLHEDDV